MYSHDTNLSIDGGAPLRWLNRWDPFGAGGGRLMYTLNVSYTTGPDSIDELYTRVQAHGIATLSLYHERL